MQSKRFAGIYNPGINWKAELEAQRDGKMNHYSADYLVALSKDWVTCACGNQCSIIPRTYNGAPVDIKLMMLGMRFMEEVELGEYDHALQTLEKIERRSICLIDQIRFGAYSPLTSIPLILL